MTSDEHLAIPDFLRITPEVAAANRAWWEANPPKAMPAFADLRRREADPDVEAFADRQEQARAAAQRARLARLAASKRQRFSRMAPGLHWDASRAQFVPDRTMTAAKFRRLLGEMPTDRHREILIDVYGEGQSCPAGAPSKRQEVPAAASESGASTARAGRSSTKTASSHRPSKATRSTAQAASHSGSDSAKTRRPQSVLDQEVLRMLREPGPGKTLAEIGAPHGWQDHSTSARLSGLRKAGARIVSERVDGVRRYRVDGGES